MTGRPKLPALSTSKTELSAEDAAKRRDALSILLAEHKSPTEISRALGISIPQFNRLLRETPGLADEVHAIMQASAIMERGRNHAVRVEIRDDVIVDPKERLAAANDLEKAAGVNYTRESGVPQIVIMGRDVTAQVRTAKAHDLEELMRVAAEATGMPEVKRYVEEKIAGKSPETGEEKSNG